MSETLGFQPFALDAFEQAAIGANDLLRIFDLMDTFAEVIERDEQALRVEGASRLHRVVERLPGDEAACDSPRQPTWVTTATRPFRSGKIEQQAF